MKIGIIGSRLYENKRKIKKTIFISNQEILMNIDKIILLLRKAVEDKDWKLIMELIEDLLYELDDPLDAYRNDEDLDEDNLW